MKIDRLIGIVTILLQTEKSTVPALAQRFEVSRRTIERDIDALCRAGVPLVTVQGYGGGVFIEPRYKLDKTLLSGPELAAAWPKSWAAQAWTTCSSTSPPITGRA